MLANARILARTLVVSFFLLAGSGLTTFARAFDIPNQTVRYSVNVAGHNAGEMEVIIERDGDVIKTTSISHLSNFAKMFLSDQTVETWFKVEGEDVLVQKGQLVSHRSGDVINAFSIDRESAKITFEPGESLPVADSDLFESTSFPIVLMATEKMRHIGGVEIREINPKKARWYEYQAPVSEQIEINGTTYKTWKITRNKRGEPGRSQTFWLDRKNHRIPVQIISIKKKQKTVMTLVSN